ncbi:chymotrypsin-like protease CTRL-1 isoform X2 [Schistocerca americana]|uniref:chymotrypsin-like protease CTRL-1 isoform X2 n=1 Tax=Schistocerca americana TaxID=7009 RepID=UPI001F4F4965|nr:chymotrypsin-like protease CTRL-1 isoform X2 [Schistocerca americana]
MATRSHCALAAALLVAMAATSTQSPHGQGSARITDGKAARLGQFPHQALVLGDGTHICGGSLITKTAVLTTAYCTVKFDKFIIRLGTVHRTKNETTAWIIAAHWAVAHPDYSTEAYMSHNVAVVFLPQKAPLSNGYIPHTLQYAELTVVPNSVCEEGYGPGFILESTLCAGNKFKGFCSYDHGGALVLKTKEGYKQIGIASFVNDKCDVPIPGGFSRVTYFLDWITKTAEITDD